GAGQLPVIGRGVPGQGRCSRSWSPAQPVAIEAAGGPAGKRSVTGGAGLPYFLFFVFTTNFSLNLSA
uniref:hypothetical protein n=1 Tax=Aeromonas enteropelogenes TaxID=29489 RepID=UPI003B9FE036